MQTLRPSVCWRCAQSIVKSPAARRIPSRSYASRPPKLAKSARSQGPTRPPPPPPSARPTQSPSPAQQPPVKAPRVSPAKGSSAPNLDDSIVGDRRWARTFTIAVIAVSGTGFFLLIGYYGALYYNSVNGIEADGAGNVSLEKLNLTAIYDKYAPHFDADVDWTEYWNGIHSLRSRLVQQARGDVLESAAGTGRNAEYYNQNRVRTLTIVDKSKNMLKVAEKKWAEDRDGEDWTGTVRFIVGDVEEDGTAEEQYDTVVQTLGLCSTDDPDRLMRSLVRLVKPGGRILLVEHGKSWFDWLNFMLDSSARDHASKHGCWWNRDIGSIVRRSEMEVIDFKRTWRSLGTNWYVVLQKPPVPQRADYKPES